MAKTVKKTTKLAPKAVAKPVAKAPVKKSVAKPVAKAPVKKSVAKSVAKAPVKKVVAKPVAKKTAVKPVAKKSVAKAPVKKTVAKPAVKTPVKKAAVKKPITKKAEDKSTRIAQHRKKIQEIKNNYEGPITPAIESDDDYGDYKPNIIGRTRFNDAELLEFRILINKKIAEAREELTFYQDQMKESEMNDDDIKFSGMEDGGHTNDKEHLSSMANRQIKFIQNLESAIVRIENKTYGICRATGNLIDKKRLMAVPHATLSMEGKLGGKKK